MSKYNSSVKIPPNLVCIFKR